MRPRTRAWLVLNALSLSAAISLGCAPPPIGPSASDSGGDRRDAGGSRDSSAADSLSWDLSLPDVLGSDLSTALDSSVGVDSAIADSATGTDSGTPALDATISSIQSGNVSTQTCVRVQGVVMSELFDDEDDAYVSSDAGVEVPRKAFYISEKGLATAAPYSGIEVVVDTNVAPPSVFRGDDVTVVGIYSEHYDNSTIRLSTSCGEVAVNGSASMPQPAAVSIAGIGHSGGSYDCPPTTAWTDGVDAEAFEGVLVSISNGSVDMALDSHGQFGLTDGYTELLVGNTLGITVAPNVGDTVQSITGFSHFSFCRRKLRPRSNAEVLIESAPVSCGAAARADHLLISEVKTLPSDAEFIEIYNPTGGAIDLSDYYLYNATYAPVGCSYYNVVTATECGDGYYDFSLRFPFGATIAAGAYQVIALTGTLNYCPSLYPGSACTKPDYEIPAGTNGDIDVVDMGGLWDPLANSFLSNAAEDLVLYRWDGVSGLVQDVDYVIWGEDYELRTDKTLVSGYAADTAVEAQDALPGALSATPPTSYQRVCYNEGSEIGSPGNGLTGHNETSEDLASTFRVAEPSPGAAAVGAQ